MPRCCVRGASAAKIFCRARSLLLVLLLLAPDHRRVAREAEVQEAAEEDAADREEVPRAELLARLPLRVREGRRDVVEAVVRVARAVVRAVRALVPAADVHRAAGNLPLPVDARLAVLKVRRELGLDGLVLHVRALEGAEVLPRLLPSIVLLLDEESLHPVRVPRPELVLVARDELVKDAARAPRRPL